MILVPPVYCLIHRTSIILAQTSRRLVLLFIAVRPYQQVCMRDFRKQRADLL